MMYETCRRLQFKVGSKDRLKHNMKTIFIASRKKQSDY